MKDDNGIVRVVYKTPSWEDYLQLGLSEIIYYGADSIQVQRRVEALLLFLLEAVPKPRHESIKRFLELRQSMSVASLENTTYKKWADIPDREGIGSGQDLSFNQK